MDQSYPFSGIFRAQALRVVDGDTLDLAVDVGFHLHQVSRFRLAAIDTPELRGGTEESKAKAKRAKERLEELVGLKDPVRQVNLNGPWNLKLCTERDPGHFGRWLATIYVRDDRGEDVCVNNLLVKEKLAVAIP